MRGGSVGVKPSGLSFTSLFALHRGEGNELANCPVVFQRPRKFPLFRAGFTASDSSLELPSDCRGDVRCNFQQVARTIDYSIRASG